MAWIYEPMETIIPNATMKKGYLDGVLKVYLIKPNPGYVLHDSAYDWYEDVPVLDEYGEPVYDEYGMPMYTEIQRLGYRPTEASVGYNYDWTSVEMLDEAGNTVTAYGMYQFFCKPETDVPSDYIFGVTNPPEIM